MNKKQTSQNGFTLIEFTVVVSVIAILFILTLPGFLRAQSTDREAEVKSNIHTIQVALERYMTDNGEYPAYLLGGDIDGWITWHEKWDGVNDIGMSGDRVASNDKVNDPLIEYDYMVTYPLNPFVDDGGLTISRTNIDGINEPGNGDPRFGYKGDVMGQGLDDMNFFRGAIHPGQFLWSEIETRRTLDHGDWMNVPEEFKSTPMFDPEMYYLFGGILYTPDYIVDNEPIFTYWPGNFFYKATTEPVISRQGWTMPIPNTNPGGRYSRYILGGYGAEGTWGMDVIRLMPWRQDGGRLYWHCPPPFPEDCFDLGYNTFSGGFGQPGGLPEVFGGGDENNGPFIPYNYSSDGYGEFVYGAPDGIPDGVIIVLTDGSDEEMTF